MNRTAVIVVGALTGAGLAAGGYWLGQRAQHAAPAVAPAASPAAPAPKTDSTGRRILYWHDPMYPQQKFDKPGKSPFMNMDLVPVYADAATEEGSVAVSPACARARRWIAAAEMTERARITARWAMCSRERRIARRYTQAESSGCVRAVSDPVRAGQVLAEVYCSSAAGGICSCAEWRRTAPRASRSRAGALRPNRSGSPKAGSQARAIRRGEPPPACVADLGRRDSSACAKRDGAGEHLRSLTDCPRSGYG
jgi:hypothetical protein